MENDTSANNFTMTAFYYEYDIPSWMWYLEIVYVSSILVLGISGNLMVILVQLMNKAKCSTDYLVINMAVFELICVGFSTMNDVFRVTEHLWKKYVSTGFCQFSWFTGYLMGISSSLLLSAVAVDRYLKTCMPLLSCYTVQAGKILAGVLAVCNLAFPIPSVWAVYEKNQICFPTNKYINLDAYNMLINGLTFACFVIVAISYTRVGLALRKRNRRRQETSWRHQTAFDNSEQASLPTSVRTSVRNIVKGVNRISHFPEGGSKVNVIDAETKADQSPSAIDLKVFNSKNWSESRSDGFDNSTTAVNAGRVKQSMSDFERSFPSGRYHTYAMKRTTLIMFMISLTYVLTHLSAWALFVVPYDEETERMLINVSRKLILINCVMNPAYFFLLSAKFRKCVKKVVCRR